ncbi:hypothetical protein Hypma_009897 [Hypsizygus marmoreus]|uniref:Uncharacterized protein n=1 Tax=Hypsizygus marmoreus TaxID=39966 RepID=A0A369JTR5_HYPMA|nr:hypothetical protein Hypma_009897 [Hypsizygus marmoreus]
MAPIEQRTTRRRQPPSSSHELTGEINLIPAYLAAAGSPLALLESTVVLRSVELNGGLSGLGCRTGPWCDRPHGVGGFRLKIGDGPHSYHYRSPFAGALGSDMTLFNVTLKVAFWILAFTPPDLIHSAVEGLHIPK